VTARSVLGDLLPAGGTRGRDVALTERGHVAQVSLRVASGSAAADAVETVIGGRLPAPGTFSAVPLEVLWLGPDEFLVVGAAGTEGDIEASLRSALAGHLGAVCDLSANRTVLELEGPRAREVLAAVCALDLHPRVFPPGSCAGTLLAGAQVILQAVGGEGTTYRLLVRPSFAAHVADWLLDAIDA
jgi:sarcosine oxidase subunit gamma